MHNFKGVIAYKGTRYYGWQKTGSFPTIEEELEKAATQILNQPVTFQAASRTDRGVHAEGQVINFIAPDYERLQRGIQALLPPDIALISLDKEKDSFHPTLDAKGKEYHYFICNRPYQLPFHRDFSWHVKNPLDLEKMKAALPLLLGERDFSAFSNERIPQEKKRRHLTRLTLVPLEEGRIKIEVEGKSFLYKMVRNLIGTLVYVGCQKISLEELPLIINSGKRALAGVTAPAHGLVLKRVLY
ncbi:MAG: tRNA pseudouridine synthase A [Chlamydiae bacterium]|nr:tRNA pseudouridine synthase A [Chlamydiota bacterium]